ncbi:MAG: hypothetical protein IT223_11925 [Crocinitomicaceae bacterium]|nr:hypothetical protein [Crocinitomicaceae bacterium]
MMWVYLLKIAGWWLLSIIKFLVVPFMMMHSQKEDWTWVEIILITSSGAAGGVFIFFHAGEYIFNWITRHFGRRKKLMTKGRRFIIRVKSRWGIRGLMMISGLISVPVAALLAARFYHHQRNTLPLMIIAFFLWSVVLTSIALFSKHIIN